MHVWCSVGRRILLQHYPPRCQRNPPHMTALKGSLIRHLSLAFPGFPIDTQPTLSYASTTSVDERGIIRRNVGNAISFYLDNLLIGETCFIDQIERAALNVSEKVNEISITLIEVNDSIRPAENIHTDPDQRIIAGSILIS